MHTKRVEPHHQEDPQPACLHRKVSSYITYNRYGKPHFSSHSIFYEQIYDAVLKDIQECAALALADEDAAVAALSEIVCSDKRFSVSLALCVHQCNSCQHFMTEGHAPALLFQPIQILLRCPLVLKGHSSQSGRRPDAAPDQSPAGLSPALASREVRLRSRQRQSWSPGKGDKLRLQLQM